ncbi:MAG: tetratricopeptide repeat protein [Spirochaetales bacterium]|jgi:outer membrane protein assembly factor BamD (BamD/ComL family)|nr:tetratricopeptide repeat protein [Spirochaetales bacterium]
MKYGVVKVKNNIIKKFALCAAALALYSLASCSSGPPVIPEDLSVMQFFQRAQEETDTNDWDNALVYYNTFIERHPDDLPNVMAARYEIAYIHYKEDEYQEAADGFQQILDFYETTPLPFSFPLWQKVLSQKLLGTLAEKGVTPSSTGGE